ncbi:MAG: hypothetical protein JW817_00020 [Clostridiales bacterium]|nr:hypothetical protein [Clostridiales bacterium]
MPNVINEGIQDLKQHVTPIVFDNGKAIRLESVRLREGSYDEKWIQGICFENPTMLPVDEIEPSFGGIVSISRELRTDSGPCDLVYLNANGFITLAECKLWRNPEARRKAVGQILDYAKDVAKWDFQRFETECLRSRGLDFPSLYDLLRSYFPDIIEQELIDRVQTNLRRGRFLLLIIGDGIRENMEDLISYVQGYGGMSFTLGLVELPVYKNPTTQQLIITPRILAKTREIERTVIRVEDGARLTEVSTAVKETAPAVTISEKDFFERLSLSRGQEITASLQHFIGDLAKEGIITKIGRGKRLSLNLKSSDDTYNFGSIQEDGDVWFYGIVSKNRGIRQESDRNRLLEKACNTGSRSV